jgi:hypothetical protein
LHKAKKIALGIEKDLAAGSFDTSLHQYKELPLKKPCNQQSTTNYLQE